MSNQGITEVGNIRLVPLDLNEGTRGPAYWELYNSGRTQSFAGITDSCTAAENSTLISVVDGQTAPQPDVYHLAALEGERGVKVGLVHIGVLSTSRSAGWLSVEMAEEAGLEQTTEAIDRALRFAFLSLDLHRVCVKLPSYKEMEIAAYEDAGFLRESQRRQAVCHDGRFFDELLYGMLRSEWLLAQQEDET